MELIDREWKEFKVKNIFEIEKCKCSNASSLREGRFPYIGATNRNNGIMSLVERKESWLSKGNCIVFICDGQGSVGYSIFKSEDFIGSTTLKIGRNTYLNKYNAKILISALDKNRVIYSYGYKRSEKRLLNETILLPVDELGNPDYLFMEEYVREEEKRKNEKYIAYAEKQLKNLQYIEIPMLAEKEWKPFAVNDLFEKIDSGKGKGLNHLYKANNNGINYIGATHRNNGVLCQIEIDEKNKKIIQQGNCIGFIRNGNGSVGYAVYKAESFVSTSDVSFAYSKIMNKYIGLFMVTSSNLIRGKYNHSYKRTPERLKKDSIMLPINQIGAPDYPYMEQYAKNLIVVKLKKYLAFAKK